MFSSDAVKVTLILQDAPVARPPPQVFVRVNSLEFAPVRAMLLMARFPGPKLVSVVVEAGLTFPTVWPRYVKHGVVTTGSGVVCGIGKTPKTSNSFCVPT